MDATTRGGPVNPISPGQRKLLKVAVRKLDMAEPAYRDLLMRYGGCRSSKDLERDDFQKIIAQLEARGFRKEIKDGEGKAAHPTDSRRNVIRKTGECLRALKMPWRYADEIAKRMWKIQKLEWCTPQQIYHVNGELIRQLERRTERARQEREEASHAR